MVATDARASQASAAVLDPVERLSEILFGLIMALTFTGAIHTAGDDKDEIRALLVGAIGCNIAWGIVDAVMYLMTGIVTRGQALRTVHRVRHAATQEEATEAIADALPEGVAKAMTPHDLESVRGWLTRLPEQGTRMVTARDFLGAFYVFLLVTLSTFPVVVPFLIEKDDPARALRFSHAVALTMLFLIGWTLGRLAGLRALLTGILMLAIGVVLAALAIALGG